jgi:hypothetical protein
MNLILQRLKSKTYWVAFVGALLTAVELIAASLARSPPRNNDLRTFPHPLAPTPLKQVGSDFPLGNNLLRTRAARQPKVTSP